VAAAVQGAVLRDGGGFPGVPHRSVRTPVGPGPGAPRGGEGPGGQALGAGSAPYALRPRDRRGGGGWGVRSLRRRTDAPGLRRA